MAEQMSRERATPEEWVEIEHAGIENTTRVAPESVEHWESCGWTVVGDKKSAAKKPQGSTGSES